MKVRTDSDKIILGVHYPACKIIEVSDRIGEKLIQCECFTEVKSGSK